MRYLELESAAKPAIVAPTGRVLLFRGDSTKIGKFDVGMTSLFGLFGHGIYLTDNKRVAGDYTSKGRTDDVIFRVSRARTKQQVLDNWLRRQAAKFDDAGKDRSGEIAYWTSDVPFANGMDWCMHTPDTDAERQKRFDFAREKWKRMSKDYEIRIKLDGTGIIQKKLTKSQGAVTAFAIPESYLAKTLVADEAIADNVLSLIAWTLNKYGDRETAREMLGFVRGREREGEDTSFREVFNAITSDSPLKYDLSAHTSFQQSLEEMGYVGINYIGGITMGGGYRHRAYVLWDDRKINRWRIEPSKTSR